MIGPSLSVVIPAFNESKYIGATMRALEVALRKADLSDAEVLLIDDGSTDGTARVAGDDFALPLEVVTQPNSGRFATRQVGIDRASGEFVLFLDARAEIDADSLVFWRGQRTDHPDRLVWIGHTRTRTEGNPYAAFWELVARVVWPAYEGVLTSYSARDFDRYPKGTGMVVGRRDDWRAVFDLQAPSASQIHSRLVSDDTALLRELVERVGSFWLSPEFGHLYTSSRTTLRSFVANAYFRGTTAVDGYAGQPGRLGVAAWAVPLVAALMVPAAVVLLVAWRLWMVIGLLFGVGVLSVLAAAVAGRAGRPAGQTMQMGFLATPFLLGFVPGMWRGWVLRLSARRS